MGGCRAGQGGTRKKDTKAIPHLAEERKRRATHGGRRANPRSPEADKEADPGGIAEGRGEQEEGRKEGREEDRQGRQEGISHLRKTSGAGPSSQQGQLHGGGQRIPQNSIKLCGEV